MKKIIYLCNPDSNKDCTKEGCFLNNGPCNSTLNRDCAVIADRYPIVIDEFDAPDDFEDLNMNPRESKIMYESMFNNAEVTICRNDREEEEDD